MKKGSIILNRHMTTQSGALTADPGTQLMSVFLGAVKDKVPPNPAERLESMGWRQMAMFECSIRIETDHPERLEPEVREWRLIYSCLGAVDAVQAAQRCAGKLLLDEFNRGEPNTPAPYLASLYVGTMEVGPIAEDGTPFNGRGPAFFGWKHNQGPTLEEQIGLLQEAAEKLAQ